MGKETKTEIRGSDGSKFEEETMWQGKPIKDWSLEEKNHFLTLLIGKCWHEPHSNAYDIIPHCKHCGTSSMWTNGVLIQPQLTIVPTIKEFMEKELPEVWEGYLREIFAVRGNVGFNLPIKVNKLLDLTNLIAFLLDNQKGWAWIRCDACTGNGDISENSIRWGVDKVTCPVCNGTGKVKHPALLFAEGVK